MYSCPICKKDMQKNVVTNEFIQFCCYGNFSSNLHVESFISVRCQEITESFIRLTENLAIKSFYKEEVTFYGDFMGNSPLNKLDKNNIHKISFIDLINLKESKLISFKMLQ